jgi:hypothetical protein
MVTKSYDIFQRLPSGPIWIQAVQGFEEARRRLVLLRTESAGDYFVYDTERAEIVAESISSRAAESPDPQRLRSY